MSDLQDDVPAAADAPVTTARKRRARSPIVFSILGVILAVALVAGFAIHPHKVVISPGDATPVANVVSVSGTRAYRHAGGVLFLTVSVADRPSLLRLADAYLDPDTQVVPEQQVNGSLTPEQSNQLSVQLMSQSQDLARKVALEKLGYTVPVSGKGAVVGTVEKGSPADGRLRPNDVIVGVDAQSTPLADDVRPAVRAVAPGSTVTLKVQRSGKEIDVPIVTVARDGASFLGITTYTKDLRYKFPIDVQIEPGPVSGDSAGLAFTLTILDELTPGNLTGPRPVAVTGAIGPNGEVQEVGGVPQKAVTARRAGVKLMITPMAEVKDARKKAGSMKVVGVKTLDEALAVLQRNGGAPFHPLLTKSPPAA
ncbi:MAG: putative secreted protein containing a domain [Actinomycetia bacterium]|nr:putative secreted protein containing a domain [Actinomycetes bacterium]